MKYELLFKYVTSIGKNMSINHKYLATKGKDHESGQIIPTMARVCDTKVIIPVQSYIFQVETCLLRHKNIYPSIEILSQYNIRFDSASINPDRIVRGMN